MTPWKYQRRRKYDAVCRSAVGEFAVDRQYSGRASIGDSRPEVAVHQLLRKWPFSDQVFPDVADSSPVIPSPKPAAPLSFR